MKNNQALKVIIVLVLTIVIVTVAIIFANKKTDEEEKEYKYDTYSFTNINVKEALELFKTDEPKMLFLGRQNCEGCSLQGPYITLSQVYNDYPVYHLDIDTLDYEDPNVTTLANKLDYPYEMYDVEGPFGLFIGYTPMLIIIKNGKQVYGNIGVLTDKEVTELAKTYGVIE